MYGLMSLGCEVRDLFFSKLTQETWKAILQCFLPTDTWSFRLWIINKNNEILNNMLYCDNIVVFYEDNTLIGLC